MHIKIKILDIKLEVLCLDQKSIMIDLLFFKVLNDAYLIY